MCEGMGAALVCHMELTAGGVVKLTERVETWNCSHLLYALTSLVMAAKVKFAQIIRRGESPDVTLQF